MTRLKQLLQRKGIRRFGFAVTGFVVLCFGLTITSRVTTPSCAAVDTNYDVAVVLSGFVGPDGEFGDSTKTRIAAGRDLYLAGAAKRLHMTGDGPFRTGDGRAFAMTSAAIADDVPATQITTEARARSTLQNALYSKPFLQDADRIILVTEAYHGLRSQASFRWAGIPAAICSAPATDSRSPFLWLANSARETLAWSVNLIRAPLYSLTATFGMPAGVLS